MDSAIDFYGNDIKVLHVVYMYFKITLMAEMPNKGGNIYSDTQPKQGKLIS